jgi:hypothetical protein
MGKLTIASNDGGVAGFGRLATEGGGGCNSLPKECYGAGKRKEVAG